MNDPKQIAINILNQMGGPRKIMAMTGAKQFIAMDNGVSFKFPKPQHCKINYVRITLNSKDLYDVEYGYIRGDKHTVQATFENLYNDQLRDNFESTTGLYLSLGTMGVR